MLRHCLALVFSGCKAFSFCVNLLDLPKLILLNFSQNWRACVVVDVAKYIVDATHCFDASRHRIAYAKNQNCFLVIAWAVYARGINRSLGWLSGKALAQRVSFWCVS